MLDELVKKDAYWRRIAFNICKNKYLADDIVQDMYVRLHNIDKKINDWFVVITMRNIFIDHIREEKHTTELPLYCLEDENNEYDLCDRELDLIDSLKWWEKELIEMSYDNSLRQIEKQLNIDHSFIYRVVLKSRNKWEEIKSK
jgi:DNA-directed RNA polymerase specialized sigma24 family protein